MLSASSAGILPVEEYVPCMASSVGTSSTAAIAMPTSVQMPIRTSRRTKPPNPFGRMMQ